MVEQVLRFLKPAPLKIYCDLTVGEGGHAERILAESSPDGRLVGFDRDESVLEVARERLSQFSEERVELIRSAFSRLMQEMKSRGIGGFDGILADFGFSSFQLDDPSRGFSFTSENFLDMRMDTAQALTAHEIVNRFKEDRLAGILRDFGGEFRARRIARAVRARARKRSIDTPADLAGIVRAAAGRSRSGGIDSATRTFQALRVAVNDELGEIASLMETVFDCINPEGVLVCISYHSLEDGIVKRAMADAARRGRARLLTRRPLMPGAEEVADNRRSRSARLRAAVKTERADQGDLKPFRNHSSFQGTKQALKSACFDKKLAKSKSANEICRFAGASFYG
jgi:16S rRNA (cytosine1402-N4)-methyltransferase